MPKRNIFRFTTKTRKNVGKLVGQFNRKLTFLKKKQPELAPYLPERLDAETVRQQIREGKTTYREEIERMKRFVKKGSEKLISRGDITETRFEMGEIKRKVKKISKEREKILEKYEPSTKKGTMGTIRANNLKPKTIPKTPTEASWKKFKESLEKQIAPDYNEEKKKRYMENYLNAFDNQLSAEKPPEWDEYVSLKEKGNLTEEERIRLNDLEKLTADYQDYLKTRKRIEALSADDLEFLYYNEPDMGIDFVYGAEEAADRRDTINRAIDRFQKGA